MSVKSKDWEDQDFRKYMSEQTDKTLLLVKIRKAYTVPKKPKRPELWELNWVHPFLNGTIMDHIYLTSEKHPLIIDNVFHLLRINTASSKYFINEKTWYDYELWNKGDMSRMDRVEYIKPEHLSLFNSLDKVLSMNYYEDEE